MSKFRKWIITALCAVCAALVGVATVGLGKEVKTANAAVASEYTIVDTPMMMKISDQSPSEGRFNLFICMPQIDTNIKNGYLKFDGVDLMSVFNEFNFFNNVKIGEKTLTELGVTAFWDNKIGYGEGEPNGIIRLHCIADVTIWQAAIQSGEVKFGDEQTPVTISEGTLVPGYTYLNGDENAVVYRANMTYVTERNTPLTYSYVTSGMTDVESVKYVQGHDGTCGYLGVSLKGDDYLGDGEQIELKDYINKLNDIGDTYAEKILVNGESGKVSSYALYNLGENGKGYFSFVIYPDETETTSITIPAGTVFPVSISLMETWKGLNGENFVYIVYKTKIDKTYVKNAAGEFVSFDGYPEQKTGELNDYRAAKVEDEYFAADITAMDAAVATALAAIDSAETVEEVDAAFNAAKQTIDGIEAKATVISNAKAELNAYKSEEGYYREAEAAARLTMIGGVQSNIDNATSKQEIEGIVSSVKSEIDTLKTASQYADEELAGVKAEAKDEIEGYLKDTEYLEEQATEREEAVTNGLAAIVAAKNETEIAQAVTDAKTAMDAIVTKLSIVEAAKEELAAYKAEEGLYREAQATERANAIATANAAFDAAVKQADVDGAIATAKAAIDALKTDAELTAEEKAAADEAFAAEKTEARAELNTLKAAVDFSKYSAESQAAINELYRTAQQGIDNALTKEQIDAAVNTFKAELAKVAQDGEVSDNADQDSTQEGNGSVLDIVKDKMGCSSVLGVSGIVTVVCAFGAAVLACKKKED
ncbi:MAG: hypothetical protein IJ284_02625 [Clostridia bacterium]|nr:hypothetical protein [Clostridia bacterium]